MANWEQYGLVYVLGRELRDHRSWAGETHIQKAAYFLQELLKVPLECRFVLYKHGPYSFELHDTLGEMEGLGLIAWEPKPAPYGPSFTEGPQGRFLSSLSQHYQDYATQIRYIAEKLGKKSVAELERLGTALFLTAEGEVAPEERAEEMVRLKPHVDMSQAQEAIAELDNITADVRGRRLLAV